jgi:hypothetical protein
MLSGSQRRVIKALVSSLLDVSRPPGDLTSDQATGLVTALVGLVEQFPEVADRQSLCRFYGQVAGAADLKRGRAGTWSQLVARHESAFKRSLSAARRGVA